MGRGFVPAQDGVFIAIYLGGLRLALQPAYYLIEPLRSPLGSGSVWLWRSLAVFPRLM